MSQQSKNKEFIIEYFNALSGKEKPRQLVEKYVSDVALTEHIEFFESVFPLYEIFAHEMLAEGNKVMVKAGFKGRHEGDFNGIPPTYKMVELTSAIVYEIANNKIISHWLVADQMTLMEQLGVMSPVS
jgi:predicted ester cyclase